MLIAVRGFAPRQEFQARDMIFGGIMPILADGRGWV